METTLGRCTRDLNVALRVEPSRYRFFQAVRLWGLTCRQPGEKRLIPASLRFRTPASLMFPPSEVLVVREREASEAGQGVLAEMEVSFLGLTGPSGTLPSHYTELLIERRAYWRDGAMHEFFDLFSHRSISLFYAAWRKYRHWVAYESADNDGLAHNIKALAGIGIRQLSEQIAVGSGGVSPLFFMYFAGLLAQKPLSACSLATLLSGYFEVPIKVEQFVGEWVSLPANAQTRLGQQAASLGGDAISGERIWARQNKLRLIVGPLRANQFVAFLPGGCGCEALATLMRFAVGHGLGCDVMLILCQSDIHRSRMDGEADVRLGFNAWVSSVPLDHDADDVRYTLLH